MAELTREQTLSALHDGWGTYVDRFYCLSPDVQAAYLAQQGYTRLADVLAHVVAWWEEGQRIVAALVDDPDFNPPGYEVDAFNAQAVERFRALDEPAVIRSFEAARQAWLGFVDRLPDSAFRSPKTSDWLHMELVGHLEEHKLP